ncbi:ABC transporter permease [Chondrinema litorale]|uniref:ABC transporter permease n=1 Tax=Chondrinema litorale TaxID=2994555 RepID=UPI00254418F1|nr:ABC transporter permease [Chondrinema litorale]UZR95661.1 ABC transporter permease [Chondrinema litorale]
MFKNYILITLRNLWKNKLFVITNILGLGIAIACCIVAYLNFEFNSEFNAFHENGEKIFKVNCFRNVNGNELKYGIVPAPMGPAIASEISGVEDFVRYSGTTGNYKFDDDYFPTYTGYVDENFADIFTLEIVKGNKNALSDRSNILLSERQAEKFFPNENPIGKGITIQHNNSKIEEYTVAGVFKNLPLNSSFRFEALTRFENYVDLREFDDTSWEQLIQVTFITLNDPSKYKSIENQLGKYIPIQNQAREDWKINAYYLEPFLTMAQNMEDVREAYLWEALNPAAVIAPNVMAALILLIACFNFTNTSIAIAAKRLKEIGIRKVLGGNRFQLILQFMGENLLLCFMALVAGLVIAEVFVPSYSQLWDFLDIKLSYTDNLDFLLFLGALLMVTALFAGSYPALFISKFEPAGILKGSLKLSGTNNFTRTLLTLQFSISLIALIAGVIFTQNAEYQRTLDMGFDKDQTIFTSINGQEEYNALKNELIQHPKILSLAGSQNYISWDWQSMNIGYNERKQDIDGLMVGTNYIKTMDIKLIEGRDFIENSATDRNESIIVNEQFLKDYGITEAVGERVVLNDTLPLTIVGVVKDIYLRGFWGPVYPTFFRPVKEENFNYLTFKVAQQDIPEMRDFLKKSWSKVIIDRPFIDRSLEGNIQEAYTVNNNIKLMFIYLSIIATLLSVTGLYTMVSLNILKKLKELGIRKVLGASAFNIAHKINREFLIILSIASVLGSVAAYYLVDMLLASVYEQYIDMNVFAFIGGIFLMFILCGFTIGYKVYSAAIENPVKALKDN